MNNNVVKLMKLIESHNYEVYIVGGFVRDYLLDIKSDDYDLCTNAPKDVLVDILKDYDILKINLGTLVIDIDNLEVEITTYRKEIEYIKRTPSEYLEVNTLIEDLPRRDFTINAICLNSNGDIIDLLDGVSDLNNKVIKNIGNIDNKLSEDPLRILRALRFSKQLSFKIDDELILGINKYKKLLSNLSYEVRKKEINKLIKVRGIDILSEYNLCNVLDISLDNYKYTNNEFIDWYLLSKNGNYLFKSKEKDLKYKLDMLNSDFNLYNIYLFGLDVYKYYSLIYDKDMSIYDNLVIKNRKEINITSLELLELVDKNKLEKVYKLIEKEIIYSKLNNNKKDIIEYVSKINESI